VTCQHLNFAALKSLSEQMQDNVSLKADFFSFLSVLTPCIVDVKSSVSHCIVCDESAEDEFSSRRSSDSAQL